MPEQMRAEVQAPGVCLLAALVVVVVAGAAMIEACHRLLE